MKKWKDSGKGCLVISWRVREFRHVCLITFQLTRQSATPLSASHHPENYSFILEQLRFPMFRVPRYSLFLFLFPPICPLYSFPASIQVDFNSTGAREFFFPTASRSFAQSHKRIRLFRSIKPYCREFYPSGFRKPVLQARKLNGNKNGIGEVVWKETKQKLSLFLCLFFSLRNFI